MPHYRNNRHLKKKKRRKVVRRGRDFENLKDSVLETLTVSGKGWNPQCNFVPIYPYKKIFVFLRFFGGRAIYDYFFLLEQPSRWKKPSGLY